MRKVQFTETVLRDANQSLIATRLYDKFEPILETMDQAATPPRCGAEPPLTSACAIAEDPGTGCARSAPRCPTPSSRCSCGPEHPGL